MDGLFRKGVNVGFLVFCCVEKYGKAVLRTNMILGLYWGANMIYVCEISCSYLKSILSGFILKKNVIFNFQKLF